MDKTMEQLMSKTMAEIKRQVDRRGDEETLKHLSLLNELKTRLGENLLSLDFADIPDVQAEGFRLVAVKDKEVFARAFQVLMDEDYFTWDKNTVDEFGNLLDSNGNIQRLTHNGVLLPDSFIRSVRYNDGLVIDIGLYKKETIRVI